MTTNATTSEISPPDETPEMWWYCIDRFIHNAPDAPAEANGVVIRLSQDVYNQVRPFALLSNFGPNRYREGGAPARPSLVNDQVVITTDDRPNTVSWTYLQGRKALTSHWTELRGTEDALWEGTIGPLVETVRLEHEVTGRKHIILGGSDDFTTEDLLEGMANWIIQGAIQNLVEANGAPHEVQVVVPADVWQKMKPELAETLDGSPVTLPANEEGELLSKFLAGPTFVGDVRDIPGVDGVRPLYITAAPEGPGRSYMMWTRVDDPNATSFFLIKEEDALPLYFDYVKSLPND